MCGVNTNAGVSVDLPVRVCVGGVNVRCVQCMDVSVCARVLVAVCMCSCEWMCLA